MESLNEVLDEIRVLRADPATVHLETTLNHTLMVEVTMVGVPRGTPTERILAKGVLRFSDRIRGQSADHIVLDDLATFDPSPYPLRTELTVIPADEPRQREIGFRVIEHVGVGAYNPRGMTHLSVTRNEPASATTPEPEVTPEVPETFTRTSRFERVLRWMAS